MDAQREEIRAKHLEFDRLSNIWDGLYRDMATSMGFSDSAFQILFALAQLDEGCLQRDICSMVCLSKQTVGSSIHKLQSEGVVYLKNAEKGRGTRVFLTDEGKRLVKERVMPAYEADLEVFASFGVEGVDCAILFWSEYMRRLDEAFQKIERPRASSEGGSRAKKSVE